MSESKRRSDVQLLSITVARILISLDEVCPPQLFVLQPIVLGDFLTADELMALHTRLQSRA